MRGIVGLVLGLGVTLVCAGGCKKENSSYCCTGADCSSRVECSDPDHPFCDNDGTHSGGNAHSCIVDPMLPDGGGACTSMADCHDNGTPFCVDMECVACQVSMDCPAPAPVCSSEHRCGSCAGSEPACARFGNTPHCGESGACVECRTGVATDCDASGSKPVCDTMANVCRECRADNECGTGLCDEAKGTCVGENDIIHVDGAAAGGLGCGTSAMPCKTIGEGIGAAAGSRMWILVAAGGYNESLSLDDKKVNIVGADGVDLQPVALGAACALVSGASEVAIENLRLHGAGGTGGNADGVRCAIGAGVTRPKLALRHVTIDSNFAQGVDVTSCDVTIERSTITNNPGGGVRATDGKMDIQRTMIAGNSDGGVSLVASDFTLLNDFIVKNGSVNSTFGGVLISMNPISGTGRFEYNTVSGNDASNGFASGVRCDVAAALAFKDDIVYSNELDPSPAVGQVSGPNCTWTYSDIGPNTPSVAGEGNTNVDPGFKNPGQSDYHLGASSLVRGSAQDSGVHDDYDGESRPQGGYDMGADEIP